MPSLEELARAIAVRVRPIERDLSGVSSVETERIGVEALAAPVVVRLPGRHGGLHHRCVLPLVGADDDWHVSLQAVRTDQLEHVDAADPQTVGPPPEAHGPAALDETGH